MYKKTIIYHFAAAKSRKKPRENISRQKERKEMITMEKIVYTTKEIQDMLGLSKNTAYNFIRDAYLKGEPFKVVKAGSSYRVLKKSFDDWLINS